MNKPTCNLLKKIFLSLVFFIITSCSKESDPSIKPSFVTDQISTPTFSYTSFNATIDEDQEELLVDLIEDHGFVWSTSRNNTIESSNVISNGKKKRNYGFYAFVKNLIGNTTYHVRAYIKMNGKIYYANEVSFTTKPGTWKKLSDFPGEGLVNATGFSVNGKGYVVGGNRVWEYSPDTDSWIQKNNAPFSTEGPTSFVINNIGYVYCSDLWQYLPGSDSWHLIETSDFEYAEKGCRGVSSFVIDGKAYIGGGVGNLNESFSTWDPSTGEWSYLSSYDFHNPNRSYACGFSTGYLGYIVGGKMWINEAEHSIIEYDFINQYSLYNGSFNNDEGHEAARSEMISFKIDNEVFLGMGYGEYPMTYGTDVGSQFDFYQFIPPKYWKPQTYPVYVDDENRVHYLERAGGVAFTIGDRAFMGLGENREYNDDIEGFETSLYQDFWEFIP